MKVPNKETTVIVCNDKAELSYMNEWLQLQNELPAYLEERKQYPICISLNGCWTDSMDRALTYIPFKDFVADDCIVETQ